MQCSTYQVLDVKKKIRLTLENILGRFWTRRIWLPVIECWKEEKTK